MAVKRVTPDEAASLLEAGWKYIDVRSIPEFDEGHPTGAYNVPFLHAGPGGMRPNPDFAAVMERRFGRDEQLVLGCRSGGRSLKAAELLTQRGYTNLVDMRGGWGGEMDATGKPVVEGWAARGLPSTEDPDGRAYSDLSKDE